MQKWIFISLWGAAILVLGVFARAGFDRRIPPASDTAVKPVNVPLVPFKTVIGTVTVRLEGVPTNPQEVTYLFVPKFPVNSGPLENTEQGTFFLEANNIPMDQSYTITIDAVYDSRILGSDGVIERRGKTYTGRAQVHIPYGEDDYDFGVVFIDLH